MQKKASNGRLQKDILMKIIIENGGSKLDWFICGEETVYSGTGINFFGSDELILSQFEKKLHSLLCSSEKIDIDLYTAGLTIDSEKKIKKVFSKYTSVNHIDIFSDMLAASRALLKFNSGISCILGTGSNCAYFDGTTNHEITFSTGYLLGDEGSGYDLGKQLLRAYFTNTLPSEIKQLFSDRIQMNRNDLLSSIYVAENPKFYIANFTHFLKENESHPFIERMIQDSFLNFLKLHPFQYPDYHQYKFGFIGSIAFIFQHHLDKIMNQFAIDYIVCKRPIKNLQQYYLD